MKRKFIVILFFLLFFNYSYSQNTVDSLTNLLENCKNDTCKIVILNELTMNLYNTNPQLCIKYANLSFSISEKENYKIHYTETLDALAVANWSLGNFDKSLEFLFEKLKIHQQKEEFIGMASTLRNIAIIYNETERYDLALSQLFKALEINKNQNYRIGIAEAYNLIGITYQNIDSLAQAEKYWLRAIDIFSDENQILQVAFIKNNLALIYKQNNKLDKALAYFNESLEVCRKYNDNRAVTDILTSIGEIFFLKQNVLSAEQYYRSAIDTAIKYGFARQQMKILLDIIIIDTLNKDYKLAFENYTKYILLKDSIYSHEKDDVIAELQIKYDTEKKEQENIILKKSNKTKALIAVFLSVFLLLMIILLVFLWRLIRIKKNINIELNNKNNQIIKQNTLIIEHKEELRQQSDELFKYKNHLEETVEERTKELLITKEKAEESDRLKTAFLNNISHEFRTPMNGIIGFSDFLANEDLSEEDRKKYANIINKSCNQLINIVSDTIAISEIQSEQTKIIFSNVDVEKIINKTLKFFQFEINQKKLEIIKFAKLKNDKSEIVTDEKMLEKIIFHLTYNAVKFTHKGSIKINYIISNDRFEFIIEDSGIGISEKMQKIIFTPYRQVEVGATRDFGGNGLGLSIVKKYLEKLNGKIELKSEPGKGTIVKIFIPVKQKLNEKNISVSNKRKKITKQTTILIVEDNEMNFLLLNETFSKYNCTILHGRTGKEAVKIFKEYKIDIILMDLKLPEINGFEAVKQIREINNEVPIIAQTSYSENIKNIISKGFNDLVIKPIKTIDLIEKIERLL